MIRWRKKAAPAIWEGVYERFADVPVSGEGHRSQFWREELTKDVEYARSGDWQDEIVLDHEALLFVLRHARPQHVLDFGGGAGQSYAYVRRVWSAAAAPPLSKAEALPPHSISRWTVVELPDVIVHGRTLFAGDDVIAFTDRPIPADLVFVKTALQYIDDWKGALRDLFALGAPNVLLEKFSGIHGKSFVTSQLNLGASVVPYRFISFDELFEVAESAGYRRVLWRRLPRIYDQSGFPPELRMGQASTLIFAKP